MRFRNHARRAHSNHHHRTPHHDADRHQHTDSASEDAIPNMESLGMPLSLASEGDTVELVNIVAGLKFRKRLADLGLGTGMTVRVMQNKMPGPLLLAIKEDTRLAVGRGMAHKIRVVVRSSHDQ
jgi:Fe2+ transport system protein FeoA